MQSTSHFGIRLPISNAVASTAAIRRIAQAGDRLGYHTLWAHDFLSWTSPLDQHHVSCGSIEATEAAGDDAEPKFFETLTSLAYVAGITEGIHIGSAVLVIPTRSPIWTAKQIATIDNLCNGRFECGVGVGAPKTIEGAIDFEVAGISRRDKWARARDYLYAMKVLWTERYPEYQGEYVSFPRMEMSPKPVQRPHPPLWLSGARSSLSLAAEFADGWLTAWFEPERFPALIESIHEEAARLGRVDPQIRIGTEIYVGIDSSSSTALRNSEKTLGAMSAAGFGDDSARVIRASSLIGSPAEIIEKIQRYDEAGVTDYEMKFIYHDLDHYEEQLTLFSNEVLAPLGALRA